MKAEIYVKRIYEKPGAQDGFRVLVDRLWLRGIKKENLKADLWLKEIAPSNELRKWFGHDPEKWEEFKSRYFDELNSKPDIVEKLLVEVNKRPVTLVYASRSTKMNQAVALKEYLLNAVEK